MEVNEGCIEHAGVLNDAPLQVVEIQDQTYGLPLGWKISQTSFAVISWMLGEPSVCPGVKSKVTYGEASQDQTPAQNSDTPNAQLTEIILRRNSCVSRLLVDLVQKSSVPSSNSSGQ
jgi:hypothetical protein